MRQGTALCWWQTEDMRPDFTHLRGVWGLGWVRDGLEELEGSGRGFFEHNSHNTRFFSLTTSRSQKLILKADLK